MQHTYDRRWTHLPDGLPNTAPGQQIRCICCKTLQIPRPAVVQDSVVNMASIKEYIAQLCSKVGIYFCPVCKNPDSDSKRHALISPACVLEAQVHVAGGE